MTSDVLYKYTNRDLFEKPERYEYTELHGDAFLAAYLADRADAIVALDERLPGTEEGSMNDWKGLFHALAWADPDPSQDNLPVLADLPGLSDADGVPTRTQIASRTFRCSRDTLASRTVYHCGTMRVLSG